MSISDDEQHDPASIIAEGAGVGTGAKLRAGWVKGAAGNPMPILFRDIGGWAVVEGCIILGKTSKLISTANAVADSPDDLLHDTLGNTIIGAEYRWPSDGKGLYVVPYEFAGPLPPAQRVKIQTAAAVWDAETRIRFRPRTGEDDYVVFASGDFCASSVGRQTGDQQIWLTPDCSIGNVLHEMGHTIGLWHEHTRADRDVYIEIKWSNVVPEARSNFVARSLDGKMLGTYDYQSIMHYPARAFAIDASEPTILAPEGEEIGQRDGFSPGDLAAINTMYP